MELSVIQIRDELQNIANKHYQIHDFFFGNFVDAISRDAVDYPLLVATLQPSSFEPKATNITLQLVLADKYNESNYEQMDEIYSDMVKVMGNIKNTFMSPRFIDLLTFTTGGLTPFDNRGQDVTCGWTCDITFEILDYELWCATPYDDYDFDGNPTNPVVCADASYTVEYASGTLIQQGTIASGGSETIVVSDCPQDLFLYLDYETGDDTLSVVIDTNSAGTITSANTTGLTSVAYTINGVGATLPLTLADTDTLGITFDPAGADGQIILTGSY